MSAKPTAEVVCGLPFCQHVDKKQTKPSIGIRMTVLVLAVIAALMAVLVLCKVPLLSSLNVISAYVMLPVALVALLLVALIKEIQKAKRYINTEIPHTEIPQFTQSSENDPRATTIKLSCGVSLFVCETHIYAKTDEAQCAIIMKDREATQVLTDLLKSEESLITDLMAVTDSIEAEMSETQAFRSGLPEGTVRGWCLVKHNTIFTEVFDQDVLVVTKGKQSFSLLIDGENITFNDQMKYTPSLLTSKIYTKKEYLIRQSLLTDREIIEPGGVHFLPLPCRTRVEFVTLSGTGVLFPPDDDPLFAN